MAEKANLIVEIKRDGKSLNAYEVLTKRQVPDSEAHIHWSTRNTAEKEDKLLAQFPSKTKPNSYFWRKISITEIPDYYKETNAVAKKKEAEATGEVIPTNEIRPQVKDAIKLKPMDLFMDAIHWKFLVHSYLRAKNILLLGFTGCGKTKSAYALADAFKKVLDQDLFVFNMGATQDPRATLIGNTHYSSEDGTFFSKSRFVRAIQTENAVVVLDELSRINPEGANILMTVLDYNQRFLALDEDENAPVIHVAKGVTFVATANVGSEFTATRTLDRALYDRFTAQLEVPLLDMSNESALLRQYNPTLRHDIVEGIADVACYTRDDLKSDDPGLTTIISTRTDVAVAEMLLDGFKFTEAMEVAVLPLFDKEGGADSERTKVMQKVQQYSHLDDIEDPEKEDEPEPEVEAEDYNYDPSNDDDSESADDDELFDLNEDTF